MADDDKKLAGEIANQLAGVLDSHREKAASVAFAENKKDVEQLKKDVTSLQKKVYDEHEPVIIWSRNFIDSYRKVLTVIVASGLITLLGLVIQLYYMLKSGK